MLAAGRIVAMQNHVKQLEVIMSVCSYCKNIREGGEWIRMEDYVAVHTGTGSSHGICPHCWDTKVLPELEHLGIKGDKLPRPWANL